MWAVVEIAKKQYIVNKGDILQVEKLKTDSENVVFDKVLLLFKNKKVVLGTPYVDKAQVKAKIQGEKKSRKIIVYKYKRRKKYRKKQGHRQIYTLLKISDIVA
jgi:large subunit ribosomal protein L21